MRVPIRKRRCYRWLCAALLLWLSVHALAQPVARERHTAEGQYRFAEGLFVRKFFDMAAEEFRHFLAQHPEHELAPEAMFRLIECLRHQDKTSDTLSAINQFQARWPQHELAPRLFLWKGEVLLRQGRWAIAASCFKRLVLSQDSVTREAALYYLAQCHAYDEKPELALQAYEKIAHQPFDDTHLYRPYALFAIATGHQQKSDLSSADNAFSRLKTEKNVPAALREEAIYRLGENHFLRSDFEKAIELYESLLVDYPDGFFAREARKRRAWAHFALKNYTKAIELCRVWQQHYPDVFDYELDYILGASLASNSFHAEALPYFVKLASHDSVPRETVLRARYHEIFSLLNLDRFQEAARKAEAFCREWPKAAEIADVHYFAGWALFQTGAFAEATQQLQQAIDSFVGNWDYFVDAHLYLIESLEKQNKLKHAAALCRRLADEERMQDRAALLLRAGQAERNAGDKDTAVIDFESLLKKFPQARVETRLAILHLGELYAEQGNYDRAVELLTELLATTEHEAENREQLLFFLGYLHFQQGKHQEAVSQLQQSLAVRDSGEVANNARYYLGGALLELGKDEEALALFAHVLKLPPDQRPKFAQSLLFRLEELFYARHQYDVSESICQWLLGWENPVVVHKASLRLAKIFVAQSRLPEARHLLEKILAETAARSKGKPEDFAQEEILSLLGEVYLLQNEYDRAVSSFEKALKTGLGMEYATRARWGLAEILKNEKRYKQALHYAVNAFVLSDEPTYTPRAMFLAIEILLAQDQTEEALTTWRELSGRFPSYAERRRQEPVIQDLLSRTKSGGQ